MPTNKSSQSTNQSPRALGSMFTSSFNAQRKAAMREIDEMYSGNCDEYDINVAYHGLFWSERTARAYCAANGFSDFDEIADEIYWDAPDDNGVYTMVHIGSMLSELGF